MGPNANGYDITNIQIAGGWNDNGRNSQFYTVSYSTVVNPSIFLPLKAVANSPSFPTESVIRTTMKSAVGALATNVYAIQVDFTPPGRPLQWLFWLQRNKCVWFTLRESSSTWTSGYHPARGVYRYLYA